MRFNKNQIGLIDAGIEKIVQSIEEHPFKRVFLFITFLTLCVSLFIQADNVRAAECNDESSTISAGEYHTVGLKEDGTVVSVGANWSHQGSVSDWSGIKAVSAATYNTVGLKEDGTVVAVGDNWYGQMNVWGWIGIKAISAGDSSTVGLKEDGTVVAAGDNSCGQLNVSDWTGIKAVSSRFCQSVGLKEDGTVVATGYNLSDWTGIKAVSAGGRHIVGLKEDGTAVAVGDNLWGQMNVSDWTGIKAISAGLKHTVGLKEDGTVVAVGENDSGQMNVSNWTGIKAISAREWSTVGLKEDGTVVAVGYAGYGQLNVSSWTGIRQPNCNQSPLANPGPDQVIECTGPYGSSVTLDGSGSSDPDSDPLTYTWTWTGGSATGVKPTVTLPLGTTVVTLTVSDGQATATATVNITVQDIMPPVTTATGGSSNWYNTNVISTFTASDSGSGVKEIHYIIDGSETVAPGNNASVTITTDGNRNISYFAVDNAGNAESPRSIPVMIDKTVPTGSVRINGDMNSTSSVSVTLTLPASDNISGVAQMCVSNTTTCTAWETYSTSKTWTLLLNPPSDVMTVYAQFKDSAGNVSGVYSDDIILDTDGDGTHDYMDCAPTDSSIYPFAPESVGADHNCNGITVTSATYDAATKRLTVQATSTLGQTANLQLNGNNMTWNAGQSLWTKTLTGVTSHSATVSGSQGTDTISY